MAKSRGTHNRARKMKHNDDDLFDLQGRIIALELMVRSWLAGEAMKKPDQGRIIALELTVRSWLAGEAMKKPDAVSSLCETKRGLYSTLQNLVRQHADTSDAICSEYVDAEDVFVD